LSGSRHLPDVLVEVGFELGPASKPPRPGLDAPPAAEYDRSMMTWAAASQPWVRNSPSRRLRALFVLKDVRLTMMTEARPWAGYIRISQWKPAPPPSL
jgi:hypothetical protein